jgi:signal transduction histidine kinase
MRCIVWGLKRLFSALLTMLLLAPGVEAAWLDVFSGELKAARAELQRTEKALEALGQPMIGNTVPEFGIQHVMLAEPPPESPFVQVDLGERRRIDTVALVPAVVDFQGVKQSPYAFPARFRLDASDDAAFGTFTPLLVRTEVDFELNEVAPVVIDAAGIEARYLRLTVTKLAKVEGRWTFALAELLALDGNRNVALGAPVLHKGGTGLPPRWMSHHLTDGRTPLGPPIDRSSVPEFDALFASIHDEVLQPWMGVDLGAVMPLDEVRLHPLHARQGADVPGFAFPSRFRVELAQRADFSDATVIHETVEDYPNPGNNAVVIATDGHAGRYVRMVMTAQRTKRLLAVALSELEVYSLGKKVSQGKVALSSGDPRREEPRPLSLLTDGHTSYGRLLELPDWLAQWEKRQALQAHVADLTSRIRVLSDQAQTRAVIVFTSFGLGIAGIVALLFWRAHRRHAREREAFRTQLARDMHDEIGSNLAGIAVISETSALQADATAEDWQEINRIAHETTDAMREMLWLVGARQESGIDLMEHLQRVATRLLPNHEVCWRLCASELPVSWPMESRRQVFLFFKEALTNILRHAKATKVELSAQIIGSTLELIIQDNGQGFDPRSPSKGMGLSSLRERAKQLGGTLDLQSSNQGTMLTLRAPLSS